LLNEVYKAIYDWNSTNWPYCIFVDITKEPSTYFVTFIENVEAQTPGARVGCWFNQTQEIILPPAYYGKSTNKIRVECILHEMMHCAGFEHEHSRLDRDFHCQVTSNDPNYSRKAIGIGNYDYCSLMHYTEISGNLSFKYQELKDKADKSTTFSAGDKALIKIFYSQPGIHHGDWHNACDMTICTKTACACGSCGPLGKGGANCGFWGETGHWTCCMEETKNSKCKTTHSGFWHAKCVREKCTPKDCFCDNCIGGCQYQGSEAHWSCCCKEQFDSECSLQFKKIVS